MASLTQLLSRRRPGPGIATAAVALLLIFAARSYWNHDPLRLLARAWPRSGRQIQARLSGGFPWAPFPATLAGGQEKVKLLSAAWAVANRAKTDSTARHAAAIASMSIGDVSRALHTLESLPSRTAQSWSDLAAAQFTLAVREEEPERLAHALVAADAALHLDPQLAEAQFNRALILERLGTRDLSRAQWEEYLRVDPESGWSDEARRHIRDLSPERSFDEALKVEYVRLASDAGIAQDFARRYRQKSRTAGETDILGNWGRAFLDGDQESASKHLRVARSLATSLAHDGGNLSFEHMVEAIDRAAPSDRRVLAGGHVSLQLGRHHSKGRRYDAAQQAYEAAAHELTRGGSAAGALRARLYAANMLHEQGRHAAAREAEEELLRTIPAGYPAYRAETFWMLGAIANSEGKFGICLDSFERSLELFEQLGENNYAAMVRGQIVFVLDRLGDPRAWKERVTTLRELGRELTSQQAEALASVTRAALMEQNWPMALSFLRLEIEVGRRSRAAVLIQSLLYRAETYGRLGDHPNALRDVREARQLLADAEPGGGRERLQAITDAVEGSLCADPAEAIRLLTRAVDFQSTRGRRGELPESLRKRARAYRAAGDADRAARDLDAAIEELERHRELLPGGEERWGAFHAGDELFRDAIDQALARHDAKGAFRYAERARARTLLETVGVPWDDVKLEVIPSGTVIVQYAAYQDGVRIFVADRNGVRGYRRPVARGTLLAEAAELREAASGDDTVQLRRTGRALAIDLIDPIEPDLQDAASLILVVDSTLSQMPFAALVLGDGRFLGERFAIAVAPSAAFALHTQDNDKDQKTGRNGVLVVSGGGAGEPLRALASETEALQRIYPDATILAGSSSTPDAFLRASRNASKIHFAGHAVSDDGTFLLLAGQNERTRRLDQARIADIRLPHTEVVVLAACGTARGQLRGTEGTISVARAFLAAGVPSVVATLWPIADEDSALFFPLLHRHLAKGATPASALQSAQREWIQHKRSPAMWAAVQVIGR